MGAHAFKCAVSAGPCSNLFPHPLGQHFAHEGMLTDVVGSVLLSALTNCLCSLPSGRVTFAYFFVTAFPKNTPNVGCALGFFCFRACASACSLFSFFRRCDCAAARPCRNFSSSSRESSSETQSGALQGVASAYSLVRLPLAIVAIVLPVCLPCHISGLIIQIIL